MRPNLIGLRIIYGFAVAWGVWAALSTLLEVRQAYGILADDKKNGPSLFLAHSHVRDAWQMLYIQTALLAILVLGSMIPVHGWHEEGGVYRAWITVLHTTMTLTATWKSICVRRDRRVLADMVRTEAEK